MIFLLGFLAQIFFSARVIIQWLLSERAKRVVSPLSFWVFSIAGSYLLCLYGCLRHDLAIVAGQFLAYYVYLWNLNAKHVWQRLPAFLRLVLLVTPVCALLVFAVNATQFAEILFRNRQIPVSLLLFGLLGQTLFTLRFVYQWAYSYYHGKVSCLPAAFWVISLIGASCIMCYGVLRSDPVLIVGHSFGMITYVRNLIIGKKQTKRKPS